MPGVSEPTGGSRSRGWFPEQKTRRRAFRATVGRRHRRRYCQRRCDSPKRRRAAGTRVTVLPRLLEATENSEFERSELHATAIEVQLTRTGVDHDAGGKTELIGDKAGEPAVDGLRPKVEPDADIGLAVDLGGALVAKWPEPQTENQAGTASVVDHCGIRRSLGRRSMYVRLTSSQLAACEAQGNRRARYRAIADTRERAVQRAADSPAGISTSLPRQDRRPGAASACFGRAGSESP